ncbi:MAG: hypothetical protein CGU28_02605 [Candidatus Dactylopiibacterium carminicum]|uniref:Cobalt transporter n=1 Tax=Candidatus Dactylopiibacterium carminicum TaxID=857335 RepID=A0A272EXR3_9RHOO|nr:CbiQ family ECF transporter T component [Candidatus Dactylopiibacterium carminicum]KAF7600532.1 hypothetical protein BGI27_02225 [Candidatus Dactylopiibacterium carminicum]PAS94899.1 MAG: hypothetical protein CGU29_01940 [Candidatus Dactylopiibacterium carminicum]PAS98035.1 MAG: hypothetical protein CGU28_02605 [Candidatus Dactylopiibacterium carminicum]PAT00537.1 MAG: hypothetical protein BSR46_02235 [Candidatus Dactylopiibacterium carminicum]
MIRSLHPAVHVTAGFFLILAIQWLPLPALLGVSALAVALALVCARASFVRVARRLRWIFLALLLLFAWQGPGRLLLPSLGDWSPTFEGMLIFAEHGLRLLVVVACIAILLAFLTREAWVDSLHALLRPFERFGASPHRFAVRLALVLDYCDQARLDWRQFLHEADAAPKAEAFSMKLRALTVRDRVAIVLLCAFFAGFLTW